MTVYPYRQIVRRVERFFWIKGTLTAARISTKSSTNRLRHSFEIILHAREARIRAPRIVKITLYSKADRLAYLQLQIGIRDVAYWEICSRIQSKYFAVST